MTCSECQARPATITVTRIVNGKKTETHLCQDCARRHTELSFASEPSFTFHNILAGLFEPEGLLAGTTQAKPRTRCDNCGLSFTDFRRLGHLGCSECYAKFEAELTPLIRRIHGGVEHTGKVPVHGRAARTRRELEEARSQLREAIGVEAYERAAELRDRIRDLERQLGQS